MVGSMLVKGHLLVTLPLKSSHSSKHTKRRRAEQDEHSGLWQTRRRRAQQSTPPMDDMLALKRKAHQFYKQKARKQAISANIIQLHSPTVDPFNTWPIQPTPDVPRMAQYFVQTWAPEHGCAFALEGHPNPYLSLLWPFALQEDMYFEALVSLCLASWLPSQSIQTKQDRMFLYHRGNVVAKLRDRLQSPEQCCDNATILTVATLGTIDYVIGEHDSATSHVEGMRQMVRMRGGILGKDPFETLLQVNISAYESLWSFVTQAKTPTDEEPPPNSMLQQGELPTYLSHPFKPEICTLLSRLPQGFCDVGLNGVFSLQMMRILSSLDEISFTFSFAHEQNYPLTPESLTPSPGYVTATEPPKLHEIVSDLQRLATLQTTLTEHILCSGLLAYSYSLRYLYFHDSFGAFYLSAMDVLTQRVMRHSPETEDLDRGCYLWSAVMIGTTLMNISCQTDNRNAVFEHLNANYGECQDWRQLSKLMSRFFWNLELESMVRRSWEETRAKPTTTEEGEREDQSFMKRKEQGVIVKEEEKSRPSRMNIRDVIL